MSAPELDRDALNAAFKAADEESPTGKCFAPGVTAAIRAYLASLPAEPVAVEDLMKLAWDMAHCPGGTTRVYWADKLEAAIRAALVAHPGERAEPQGDYELAETVHGEIVRIVKRSNGIKEPIAHSGESRQSVLIAAEEFLSAVESVSGKVSYKHREKFRAAIRLAKESGQ